MNVLNLEHISKIYGDKVIFDDISCGIHQGDKIGIIGINGTGKTTFLRILAGLEEADEGQVITQNGLRITYLPQHPEFPEGATILSYVTQGQKEQILKGASLQAKQIHEELIEEAKRTAGGLDEKASEEAKNQEEKEAGKLKDVIEELKVSAREKKGAAVQLVLSELI